MGRLVEELLKQAQARFGSMDLEWWLEVVPGRVKLRARLERRWVEYAFALDGWDDQGLRDRVWRALDAFESSL